MSYPTDRVTRRSRCSEKIRLSHYLINETDNTMTVFAFDDDNGERTELQVVSTLPSDCTGDTYTSEVRVHPSGKFTVR